MARKVVDPHPFAKPPVIVTGEQLREEFAGRWSDGKRRARLLSLPEQCLLSRKASWRDKLDAWGKIVNRLGLDEKQRHELTGPNGSPLCTPTMLEVIVVGQAHIAAKPILAPEDAT